MTVLLVGVDRALFESVERPLARAGHRVSLAGDAAEAADILSDEGAHVVIADMEALGTAGLEPSRLAPGCHVIMLADDSGERAIRHALSHGTDDFLARPFGITELLARVNVGLVILGLRKHLRERDDVVQKAEARLAEAHERLGQLSMTDDVTGLFNRRSGMAKLDELWLHSHRYKQPLSAAVVRIDGYKQLCETHGPGAEEAILRSTSEVLRAHVRDTDFLCRLDGEEFLVLFPNQTNDKALVGMERCRRAVEQGRYLLNGAEVQVTLSIGMATRGPTMSKPAELLKALDEAACLSQNAIRTAPAAPGPAAEATAPHSEFQLLLDRCDGDRSLAANVASRFCSQAPAQIERLGRALAKSDIEDLRRAANSLKGLATKVGVHSIADPARDLERRAFSGDLTSAQDVIAALAAEVARATPEIEALAAQLSDADHSAQAA